jgi:hypothetical protein
MAPPPLRYAVQGFVCYGGEKVNGRNASDLLTTRPGNWWWGDLHPQDSQPCRLLRRNGDVTTVCEKKLVKWKLDSRESAGENFYQSTW